MGEIQGTSAPESLGATKPKDATRRWLVASSRSFELGERLDLLIHALAQLPDDVNLDIVGDGPAAGRLRLLARAYGIEDRVRVVPALPPAGHEPVFSSAANLSAAPIQPTATETALVLDVSGSVQGLRVMRTVGMFVESFARLGDPPASIRINDDCLRDHRIVVITNVPAAYRVELFSRVAQRLGDAGASFDVVYLARSASHRPWIDKDAVLPFEHHFLRGVNLPRRGRPALLPLDLETTLMRLRPTLVVSGGFSPFVSARASRWAARAGIAFGVYSGETKRMPTARSAWRRPLRRWIVRRASFAITYGFESGEYLISLEPALPFVYARNTSSVSHSRKKKTFTNNVRILTIADLNSERKGVDILVDALRLIPELQCDVAVVGGGLQLGGLQERARGDDRIRFLGPLPREQALAEYERADVFAFPTRQDVYGLAMVEAMGAGLATLVSNAPGALGDLAVDGVNCLIVPTHEPEAWARALRRVISDQDLRTALGEHAEQTITRRWSLEHSADAIIAGFRLGSMVGPKT
jgi:glycosyltransferase involved in cell wall biosynthesis